MPSDRKADVHGLFTAMITPFDGDGRPDSQRVADLVRFQISKGTEGLYVGGSTGLGPLLSPEERKTLAEAVIAASDGKVPVVVQVGCADTATTVELARHAERAGVDAVASLTPYYYRPGEVAIVKHFESVSRAVSIPLFAYNMPQFTGNNLQASTVAEMARRGTIVGIKDSSRDLLHLIDLLRAVPEGFVVMNGTEEYALSALMSGADGLVSGASSALPEVFKSLVSAHGGGDYRAASESQRIAQKVKEMVKSAPIPAYYAILRERGVECGNPRAPFQPLDGPAIDRIVEELKGLRLI